MVYLRFFAIAAATTVLFAIFGMYMSVCDYHIPFNFKRKISDDTIIPFSGIKLVLITLLCFASAFAVQVSLYKNAETLDFIKLYGLFILVLFAAIADIKRRIIPNVLIITGLFFRTVIYVYEIISGADMTAILKNDLIGFAIGFVLLAVISFVTKGSLGFGDVKLFGLMGLIIGSFGVYCTLLLSLVLSAITAVIGIISKKMNRKDSMPFGPFIFIGYVTVIFLSCY